MKRFLQSKLIIFEKNSFPSLYLKPVKEIQLLAFDWGQPYLLSFQPIQYSRLETEIAFKDAVFLELYERKRGGTWQGHFFGSIVRNTLKLNFKYFIPQNELLKTTAAQEQIEIDLFKRYHSDKFSLETASHSKGLGTLLFSLGVKAARQIYGTEFIDIDLVEKYRGFYLKRFKELGVSAMPGAASHVLYGKW